MARFLRLRIKYQYNGKELNSDFGLEWLDYGFRFYDPAIGRFPMVDALADKFPHNSVYNYAEDRPVNGIDLDGLEWAPPRQMNGDVDNKALEETLRANGRMSEGMIQSVKDFGNSLLHPIDAVKGMVNAALNPRQTFEAIKNDFNEDPAFASGKLAGSILLAKGVGKVVGTAAEAITASEETAIATQTATKHISVQANKIAGDAFRDEVASIFKNQGRNVKTEVYKSTPFGKRYIDIEVSKGGKVLGGVETKLGKSAYTVEQRAKDYYLKVFNNYPVNVIRKP